MRTLVPTLLALSLASAEPPSITVHPDRLLPLPDLDGPVVEPHLSINPKNPNNWVGAAMVAHATGSYRVFAVSTRDAGATWSRRDLGGSEGADVWTAFLADGTALVSYLSEPRATLFVTRSVDGGLTWAEAVAVARGQDHPTLLVGGASTVLSVSAGSAKGKSGKARDAVVVAKSDDGGVSFSELSRTVINNLSYEPNNPTQLPDGTLAIAFAEHHRPGIRRRLNVQRDWLLLSTDQGRSFSEPVLISESCDGSGGWSSLAAAGAEIYHVCVGSNLNGVQFRRSADRGETWSDPIRLDHPGDATPQAWAPVVAVNPAGVIAIAWSDARNDRSTIKGNLRCKDIFVTASIDGGRSFAPEARVSRQSSCPGLPRNIASALRFPAGGEYMGLAAGTGNQFQLLWADSRNDLYRLYTSTVIVAPRSRD